MNANVLIPDSERALGIVIKVGYESKMVALYTKTLNVGPRRLYMSFSGKLLGV